MADIFLRPTWGAPPSPAEQAAGMRQRAAQYLAEADQLEASLAECREVIAVYRREKIRTYRRAAERAYRMADTLCPEEPPCQPADGSK